MGPAAAEDTDEGEDEVYFKPHVKKMRDAIDNVRRMREAVGEDVDLNLELHRRLTPAEAVVFARGVEQYHPMFIEDPIRPEGPDAMARVAEKIHIPIATGERFANLYEFQALMVRGGVDYARADLCHCGGITAGVKIAAIAEAAGIACYGGSMFETGLSCMAGAQMIAATRNISLGCEFYQPTYYLAEDVLAAPFPVANGEIVIPDGPGLGVEVDPDRIAKYETARWD